MQSVWFPCSKLSSAETHQQVTLVDMHVLVHEIQNGQPEGREGGQRKQGGQMLEENLEHTGNFS